MQLITIFTIYLSIDDYSSHIQLQIIDGHDYSSHTQLPITNSHHICGQTDICQDPERHQYVPDTTERTRQHQEVTKSTPQRPL